VIANAVNAAIPFVLLPILSRALSPVDFALVAMFSIVMALAGVFTGLMVHGAITARYGHAEFHLPRYVNGCLVVLGVSTFLTVLLAVGVDGLVTSVSKLPLSWIVVAIVTAAAQVVVQIRLVLWQMAKRPRPYVTTQIAMALGIAVLSVVFVFGMDTTWRGRIAAQAIIIIVAGVMALGSLYARGLAKGAPTWPYVRDALRYGIPLLPHAVGTLVAASIDRVLIANLLSLSAAGVYVIALQFATVIVLVADAVNKAFVPWLFEVLRHDDPRAKARVVQRTYLYFGGALVTALIFGAACSVLIPALFGAAYRGITELMLILTTGMAFGAMYYMVTNYILFHRRTELLSVVTLSGGFLNALVSYSLISRHGVIGAAQGFAIGQVFVFFGTWWLAQQTHPMPWKRALRWPARLPAAGEG
jgi:O-antigen/teichoic acid export membrane protein